VEEKDLEQRVHPDRSDIYLFFRQTQENSFGILTLYYAKAVSIIQVCQK